MNKSKILSILSRQVPQIHIVFYYYFDGKLEISRFNTRFNVYIIDTFGPCPCPWFRVWNELQNAFSAKIDLCNTHALVKREQELHES
jgi:hypothetical protein